ncbi:MAG: DNA polymerase III subunit delta [Candidatus Nanopelagicales bacterium]
MSGSTLLISGAEELVVDREINSSFQALKKSYPDIEKHYFAVNEEDAWSRFLEASSPSLFGGMSLIILDNLNVAEEKINPNFVNYLKNTDLNLLENYFLILIHRGGSGGMGILKSLRTAKVKEIKAEKFKKSEEYEAWIKNEFRNKKRKITVEAAALLKAAVGEDLRELAAAVSQLTNDVLSDPISEIDIMQYYQGIAEIRSYEIADAILNKKASKALNLLYASLEQEPTSAIAIVNSISSNIRYLVRIAGAPKGMSDADIAKEIAINPFRIKFLRGYLRNWSPKKLADATMELAKVDASLKAGVDGVYLDASQKRFLIEHTIRKVCVD